MRWNIEAAMIAVSLVIAVGSQPDTAAAQTNGAYDAAHRDYGTVEFGISRDNAIVGLNTTLRVPAEPHKVGTLFVWPGLQPDGSNYYPIDNGVLQTVLSWGPSCAPGKQPSAYSTWWVSAQYVNTYGHEPGYTGCQGGPIMPVRRGDHLRITMSLHGTSWRQVVFDVERHALVGFQIDMKGQSQNYAHFSIEPYDGVTSIPVVHFSNTTMTFAHPEAQNCKLVKKGLADATTTPASWNGGRKCSVAEITLRPAP